MPLGSCRPTGHGTLSDVGIFSLSGVEPDIQVQGKFTLFGGARLLFSAVLVLKCTKLYFGWRSAPDPARGAYSAPPVPLAGFKRPTSKGKEGKGGSGGRGRVPSTPMVVMQGKHKGFRHIVASA